MVAKHGPETVIHLLLVKIWSLSKHMIVTVYQW